MIKELMVALSLFIATPTITHPTKTHAIKMGAEKYAALKVKIDETMAKCETIEKNCHVVNLYVSPNTENVAILSFKDGRNYKYAGFLLYDQEQWILEDIMIGTLEN